MPSPNRSVLWFFLSTLLAAVANAAIKCPPEEMIQPCKCIMMVDNDEKYPNVGCGRIRSLPAFNHVLESSMDRPFTRLVLHEIYLNYIPVRVLKKGVRHLFLEVSAFVDLFDRVPEENHKLQSITAEDTKILRGIDWKFFRNLRNLTTIQLDRVPVKKLDKEFLENVQPSLQELRITDSNIYKLDDKVFSALTNIKSIDISGGRLTALKRSMFPKENKINILDFDNNRISSLPDDIFHDMPHLDLVYLSQNPIKTLPERVFGNFREGFEHLAVEGTDIVCNCDLRWILQRVNWRLSGKCDSPESLKDKDIQQIGNELDYCDDA